MQLYQDHRRTSPRVSIEALCLEHQEKRERHALVVDLSESGVRIERPAIGGTRDRIVQLEFEIPEVDEVVWAKGLLCFEEIRRAAHRQVVRSAGVQIIATTERHRRMLREYVNDSWRSMLFAGDHQPANEWMMRASCYRD